MTPSDRRKLEEAAVVSFHCDDEAESLVECVRVWWEALSDPDERKYTDRLKKLLRLRKNASKLGVELKPTVELLGFDDSDVRGLSSREWPVRSRRELVGVIMEVWREHGGRGVPSSARFVNGKHEHDGPMIRLMEELFKQAGVPVKHSPGAHTLHDDIRALTGRTTN